MKKQLYVLSAILLVFSFWNGIELRGAAAFAASSESVPAGDGQSPKTPPVRARKPFKITTNVTMVTTDVTVVGPDTSNLSKNDFVVYDNDVPNPVSYFSRNEMPLAIALLIDTSKSVEPYLPLIQLASGSLLRNLNPDDEVVLYSFNNSIKRRSDLTYDRYEIAKKVSELDFNWGTNIYDAIIDAAEYLQENAPNQRRAIIMISDNMHVKVKSQTEYWEYDDVEDKDRKREKARMKSMEAAVTLFSIQTPGPVHEDVTKSLPAIKHIGESTGGEITPLEGWSSLQLEMDNVLTKLRMQYTLGFNPSDLGDKGTFHKLKVKFSDENRCPSCRVLSRAGYYAGVSSPVPLEEHQKKRMKVSYGEADKEIVQLSVEKVGSIADSEDLFGVPFRVGNKLEEDGNGKGTVKVVTQIDVRRIKLKEVGNEYDYRFDIGVFYFDKDLKVLGSDMGLIQGRMTKEKLEQVKRLGLLYGTEIPVKTPYQTLKVVVYDENTDQVGTRYVRSLY